MPSPARLIDRIHAVEMRGQRAGVAVWCQAIVASRRMGRRVESVTTVAVTFQPFGEFPAQKSRTTGNNDGHPVDSNGALELDIRLGWVLTNRLVNDAAVERTAAAVPPATPSSTPPPRCSRSAASTASASTTSPAPPA